MRLKGFAGLPNGSRGYFQEEKISVINLNCHRIGRLGYQHDLEMPCQAIQVTLIQS